MGSSPLVDKTEKLLKEVITLARLDDEYIRVGQVSLKLFQRRVVSENAELIMI